MESNTKTDKRRSRDVFWLRSIVIKKFAIRRIRKKRRSYNARVKKNRLKVSISSLSSKILSPTTLQRRKKEKRITCPSFTHFLLEKKSLGQA